MIDLTLISILLLNILPPNLNIVNTLKNNHHKDISSIRNYENNYNLTYHISVQRYNIHSCSGTILNEKFILTAGHCVVDFYTGKVYDKKTFSILAGTKNLKSNNYKRIQIEKIIPHPKHSFYHYNIALLKLIIKLQFSDSIQPIPFYADDDINKIPINTEIQISGWRCSNIDQPLLDHLKIDKLIRISKNECNEQLNDDGFEEIFCLTHKNLYKNIYNDGICIGDTGGPAVYNGQLLGVANFVGFECKNDDRNGFSNINFISKWIIEKIY